MDNDDFYNYCFYLHDTIVEVIVLGEKYDLFKEQIIFKNNSDSDEFTKISEDDDVIDWLIRKEYKNELNSIYLKNVFVAIISDFCNYIFEALKNARKGKLTVAFSLLRKPLKDNLFVLERILIDKEQFYKNFTQESQFLNFATDKVDEEEKRKIINKVYEILEIQDEFEYNLFYELRYNKKWELSFEPYWQRATHLITTSKHYTTKSGNINFIFSNEDDKKSQLSFLYTNLSLLLFYSYLLIMKITTDEIGLNYVPKRKSLERAKLGITKCMMENSVELNDLYKFICKKCGNQINAKDYDMFTLINKKIKCKKCKSKFAE